MKGEAGIKGRKRMDIFSTDQKYIASTYKRFPVAISHGKGSEVWDFDGKRYIDLGSGIGVTAFGIADEDWQKAVIEQIEGFDEYHFIFLFAADKGFIAIFNFRVFPFFS